MLMVQIGIQLVIESPFAKILSFVNYLLTALFEENGLRKSILQKQGFCDASPEKLTR